VRRDGRESPAKSIYAGSFQKKIFRTLRAGEKGAQSFAVFEVKKIPD
jgi:hypothetical protein